MRRLHFSLVFCCLAALLASPAPLLAQSPNQPVYPGTSETVYPSNVGDETDGAVGHWTLGWTINGKNYSETGSIGTNADGWAIVRHTQGYTITVPSNAPLATTYGFSFTYRSNGSRNPDTYVSYGDTGSFSVVALPPTLPAAGNPAFSWQGSVAGVNTGNGNKTTTLPVVGWTMRGGMGVSCALYHNSQGGAGGTYGYKWNLSYLTYISPGPGSNVTLHWDNGLTYASISTSGTLYTLPYGILDTLNSTGSGTFTMKTPSQTVYTFGYAPNGTSGNAYLSKITDMDGNTLTINHNSDTTISTVVDSTNRTLTYAYSGGHLASVKDPLGRLWYFNYGAAGGTNSNNLWYVTLPTLNGNNYAEWFGYDSNSNITAMQSPQGHAIGATSTFGYDGSSPPRLLRAKDSLGSQTTFAYNASSTVITDPNGHTTTHTYGASRLTSVTDALNYSTSTAYDYNNIVTSTTDKRGYVWSSSSHLSSGNSLSTSTDPLGYGGSRTYDSKNKVVQSVDAVGNVTANTFSADSKEDLLTTAVTGTGSAPFKATSKVGGYSYGLPTTFTDPLGYGSSAGYDGNGYPNSATDANGNKSTAIYNALGWKTSSTDANNHTTTYTYDNWGRVTAVTAPDNTKTTTAYDLDGNVLTVTDANNHTVTNVYDGDNRLTQTTNGRGDVVKYAYDGPNGYGSADRNGQTQYGLLSSKTDGNNHTTTYAYTARNEPYQTVYPDGTSENCAYDANGNVITRTSPNSVLIRYAYDADNRLTDITYPHLHATHFDYDADGRKTHMSDATGDTYWYFTYDGLHENQQTTPQGTVYFTYDGDGRRFRRSINTPATGQTSPWTWTYDSGGRLISLQSPADGTTTYTYDAANRLSTKTKGSGDYELYGYDACNEVTSIGYWFYGGTMQNSLTYSYDPAGNVLDCNQGWYDTTYTYDGADQLVSESSRNGYPPPARAFTYDHNGNRLTQTVNGQVYQSFSYDAHDKLTSGTAGNETDGYDLSGNETSTTINGGTYHETWDDEDRLTSVTTPGGITDTFVYNGLGLRVGKTDSTGSYSYVCDGATPGSPVLSDGHAVYTPGLSENRGGTSAYYSNDRLGNLWTLDGTSQNQLTYEDFSGFGTPVSGGSGGSAFGFGGGNGCQTDADTGLVLMGHRYYDTRIGRFISQDPAGAGGNWYAYAGNSPTNAVDPDGLDYIDASRVPGDWQQQALANDSSYNGEDVSWDSSGILHWSDGENDHSYILNDMSGGADWSASSWIGGGTGSASLGDGNAINTGFGDWVDNQASFGLVSAAGKAWGDVDSGHGSRAAAIGLSIGAVGAVAATALTAGEDTAAVDATRPLLNVGREELLATLSGSNKLFNQLWGQGIKGATAAVENPVMVQGLKKEVLEAYREIAFRQIEEGFNSSGVHTVRIQIIDKLLSR